MQAGNYAEKDSKPGDHPRADVLSDEDSREASSPPDGVPTQPATERLGNNRPYSRASISHAVDSARLWDELYEDNSETDAVGLK